MYPDSSYAQGRGSFLRPVPPPLQDPDAEPTKTITLSCEWLPYIRGALMQLLLQASWDTSNPAALLLAQQRAFNLINAFSECTTLPAFSCPYDFSASGATDDGFVVEDDDPGFTPDFLGEFISGVGWKDTLENTIGTGVARRGVAIKKTFSPSVDMNAVIMNFNLTKGVFSGYTVNTEILAHLAGGGAYSNVVNAATLPDGPQNLQVGFVSATIDYVLMRVWCGADSTGAEPGGSADIFSWGYNRVGGGCS